MAEAKPSCDHGWKPGWCPVEGCANEEPRCPNCGMRKTDQVPRRMRERGPFCNDGFHQRVAS